MKKSKFLAIFVAALSLIIALTPCVAFAAYDVYDLKRLERIVEAHYSDENFLDVYPYLVAGKDSNGTIVLYGFANVNGLIRDDDYRGNWIHGADSSWICFYFSSDNIYAKPTYFNHTDVNRVSEYMSEINSASFDLYNADGSLFFQQGMTNPQNPNTPSSSHSLVLSSLSLTKLQGVLNEVVAILPMLMSVLISYLAIRKGLKFVFSILRSM